MSRGGLRVRVLGESDRRVVFNHGLGASIRYSGTAYDRLADRLRLLFVDLLGFGGSQKPKAARYDIASHAGRVADALNELHIESPLLVAHSTGAVVAMILAAHQFPGSRVIAFGAPIFPSKDAARRHLRKLGPMQRLMAIQSPWARRLCALVCDHRELARPARATFRPNSFSTDGA